jgi:hypothetical protein
MPYLFLGILLLLGLLALARGFANADPAKLGRFLRWFLLSLGVTAAIVIIVLLVLSERLGTVLIMAAGLSPLLMRARALWQRLQGAGGPAPGQSSDVETAYLRMHLDHDTGTMTGVVLQGPERGRRLDELSPEALVALWRTCRVEDEPSASLLEAYLDRLWPEWRDGGAAEEGPPRGGTTSRADAMTRDEACAILGLSPGATAEQVKEAHRHLMMKMHPDHGGSTYLAAKINRAKEVLLGN